MAVATKPERFKAETDLCAAFLATIGEDWTPYAETFGWDILLSRKADGLQIGVQAKLRLGAEVITQALEERWADSTGPDCRAVLVPDGAAGGFDRIAAYIGFTIIRMKVKFVAAWEKPFDPPLPGPGYRPHYSDADWHLWAPARRCPLPEYVPDVAAGASGPAQLSDWKIKALKIEAILDLRGYVTRGDFRALGLDHRRWLSPGTGWLTAGDGGWVRGATPPGFKEQHPRVFAEVVADAAKWMPPVERSLLSLPAML